MFLCSCISIGFVRISVLYVLSLHMDTLRKNRLRSCEHDWTCTISYITVYINTIDIHKCTRTLYSTIVHNPYALWASNVKRNVHNVTRVGSWNARNLRDYEYSISSITNNFEGIELRYLKSFFIFCWIVSNRLKICKKKSCVSVLVLVTVHDLQSCCTRALNMSSHLSVVVFSSKCTIQSCTTSVSADADAHCIDCHSLFLYPIHGKSHIHISKIINDHVFQMKNMSVRLNYARKHWNVFVKCPQRRHITVA